MGGDAKQDILVSLPNNYLKSVNCPFKIQFFVLFFYKKSSTDKKMHSRYFYVLVLELKKCIIILQES